MFGVIVDMGMPTRQLILGAQGLIIAIVREKYG
jgi:hypothetical protein